MRARGAALPPAGTARGFTSRQPGVQNPSYEYFVQAHAERLFPGFCCPPSPAFCSTPLSCEHLSASCGVEVPQALAGLEMRHLEQEPQGPGSLV